MINREKTTTETNLVTHVGIKYPGRDINIYLAQFHIFISYGFP
jgi:hypothetical protein